MQVGGGKYISYFWTLSSESKPKVDDVHWLRTDPLYVFKQTKQKNVVLPNLFRLFSHGYGNATTLDLAPVQSSCVITWHSQRWLSLKNLFAFKDRKGNIGDIKIVKYSQMFYNLWVKYLSLLRKMQKYGFIIPNWNTNLNTSEYFSSKNLVVTTLTQM